MLLARAAACVRTRANAHAPASADQGPTTEESHLALKTVCSALFRLLARVDAAPRSAILGGGGGDKSDGEAKPFCCCFIRIPPHPTLPIPASPASLHAVSRYPALISSALDMKGLQMQFDGFMRRLIRKQSTAQRGKAGA